MKDTQISASKSSRSLTALPERPRVELSTSPQTEGGVEDEIQELVH